MPAKRTSYNEAALLPSDILKYQQMLITWFEEEFRDLPWRQTRDPYRIWVSEIMLQQTQVKTVLPYYERFVAAFPTVHDLAAADLSQVLKLWEGLGYYARARNLHKAAQKTANELQGNFPQTMEEAAKLPGIGSYTAAAILSIAFGVDLPVIDGNVNRVLARLFMLEMDPKSTEGRRNIRETAEKLLARGRAGDYNQALMELGAMICTPRRPKCLLCPVSTFCKAFEKSEQDKFPIKSAKKERPHVHIVVGLVWNGDRLLIDRRLESGLLGGLWEFPGGKVEEGESYEQTAAREIKEELGVDVEVVSHFMSLNHAYTHFSITLHAYTCRYLAGSPQAVHCAEWRWVRKDELSLFAFPRANGRVIAKLLAAEQHSGSKP
jgi:A/G-specific adenine glycosylase